MYTERICVFGIVQGVGFRPFVSRIATAHSICGTVCNKGSYVEILAQGSQSTWPLSARIWRPGRRNGRLF